MSDDEFSTELRGPGNGDKRAPRFSWTPAYEATFFPWDRAAAALREQHGAYPTKSHLVNKSDNARKKFRLWRGLREHSDFLYNPATRTVTGTDDAWKAHIEKEPLSRALRGRTFEHEDYMEILYPDVVGSGGAPKRIMKPKRKGPDTLPGCEDTDMPGTAPECASETRNPSSAQCLQPSRAAPYFHHSPAANKHCQHECSHPPDETTNHTRKRFAPQLSNSGGITTPDPRLSTHNTASALQQQNKRRRISSQTSYGTSTNGNSADGGAGSGAGAIGGRGLLEEGVLSLAELLRAKAPPRWPEQALEIFFRDFAEEDMDLQLKIAEKALADENKAMVFCKMPPAVRKHWVKRLREVHNRAL
ncbi:unnamed protein product [Parascedosporium putredinis]|uniref:Myb/SANT-like domain-containing protein n=1 Tax=Parascedosporium putredinis TaxID=1442378 RepID=A0A9P1GZG8_9PEZI|nr:unnamed protein product [Parascedosporium putredinis]CAI7991770.1 unnamed protein product [Parascedosporium putredinis]